MLFALTRQSVNGRSSFGAALALVVASGIGVMVGSALSNYVDEKHLHYAAGAGFVIIGLWTLWKA